MDEGHEIQSTVSYRNRVLRLLRYIPYGKKQGAAHFAAHGLHVGNGVGCLWAAHGNFAMQIRLPTTSIWKQWVAQWSAQ